MTDNSLNSTTSILSGFIKIILVIALLALGASAQTKGTTPIGLSPGSPSGSYPLSDFETVNLFNGGLNFRLPLLNIGGRGGTGYSLPIHIEQKWSISKEVNPHQSASYSGHSSWWSEDMDVARKLDVGRLQVRRAGTEDFFGPDACGSYRYKKTLTRITFTAPDGTEYELRDQYTGGQPATPAACSTGFNRHKIFVTADGTSATYISDDDIIDAYDFGGAGEEPFRTTGDMMLKDGTHFHLFQGNVMWMRDRNGNKVAFGYDSFKRITSITDTLNRTITINYGSAQTTTYYDQITFKGFGGTPRTLKIGHCLRSDAMRSDYSEQSPLFSVVTVDNNNPIVINYIELPDGRRYQIQYNPYAEIARVVMPTGGAIEYEWNSGLTDGAASGLFTNGATGDKYVYRRVVERRLYPDGGTGSAWESKMTYSRPESTTSNTGYVEVKQYKQYNSSDVLLGRTQHYFYGSARDSLLQKQTDYPAWQDSKEYKTETFDTNGITLLRRVENNFEQRDTVSWWTGLSSSAPPNDVRLKETITTLADTNQVSKQVFGYDDTFPFNNQNNVKEYDFGNGAAGSLLRETSTSFETGGTYTGTDVHIRNLAKDVSVYDGSNHLRAQTVFEYDNYTAVAFHALIKTYPLVGISQSPTGLEPSFNSNNSNLLRGNVTKTRLNLLDSSGGVIGSINSYAQYDVLGNVVKAIDPRSTSGNLIYTTFDYADNFGIPDSEARTNSGASELNTSPGFYTYAIPTVTTNALGHTTYTQYDYYVGKPVNFEDANGIVGSGSYDDLLDRPKLVKRAIGTTAESHSTFNYDDTNREITTANDQDALDDGKLVSKLVYDKMGRTVETRQYEGGTNYIAGQTHYDPLGRPFETSNPFRPWQSETAVWTTRAYDGLGRETTVTTTTDNAVVTTSYSGNTVTVTDQAGKSRKSVTDALGRLTAVYEAPDTPGYNYLTSYAYDTLDNLTTVTQGTQTRNFVYDSLKRLISATNPESGRVCYGTVASEQCQANGYDAAGNLIYKTDARLVRATYVYDALNRNTSITYTNDPVGTPTVTRTYDGATNGKGQIWKTETAGNKGSRTTVNSYDPAGRPATQSQQFHSGSSWSAAYAMSATYDRAGHLLTQTYPSGHTVNYAYDSAGRNSSFSGNLGEGVPRTYANEFQYTAMGGLQQEKFGTDTPLYHKQRFNQRGQLWDMRLSTVSFASDPGNGDRGALVNYYSNNFVQGGSNASNNGNLLRQEIYIPGNSFFQDNFIYNDPLNRLDSISETLNGTGNDTFRQA